MADNRTMQRRSMRHLTAKQPSVSLKYKDLTPNQLKDMVHVIYDTDSDCEAERKKNESPPTDKLTTTQTNLTENPGKANESGNSTKPDAKAEIPKKKRGRPPKRLTQKNELPDIPTETDAVEVPTKNQTVEVTTNNQPSEVPTENDPGDFDTVPIKKTGRRIKHMAKRNILPSPVKEHTKSTEGIELNEEVRWGNAALYFLIHKLGHTFEPPPHMQYAGDQSSSKAASLNDAVPGTTSGNSAGTQRFTKRTACRN